jgi:deazaflavin-dependent oxidoreductase (nitroreductase family)
VSVADRLARFNKRFPNRVIHTFASSVPPLSVVVHQGRRSGRSYRTPVISFPTADGYVVSLPYGAGRDWLRNVLAAGACTLERGGRRLELTAPVVVGAAEGMALVPAFARPALRLLRVRNFVRLRRAGA